MRRCLHPWCASSCPSRAIPPGTMRFGRTTKVLAKRMINYYRISWCLLQVWLDMAAVLVRQRALADAAKCISQAASAAASHEPDLLCAQGALAEVREPSILPCLHGWDGHACVEET